MSSPPISSWTPSSSSFIAIIAMYSFLSRSPPASTHYQVRSNSPFSSTSSFDIVDHFIHIEMISSVGFHDFILSLPSTSLSFPSPFLFSFSWSRVMLAWHEAQFSCLLSSFIFLDSPISFDSIALINIYLSSRLVIQTPEKVHNYGKTQCKEHQVLLDFIFDFDFINWHAQDNFHLLSYKVNS